MAPLKKKGDLAELKVAADLVARGCSLYIPFGEDSDYDLLADFEGRLHRVQVKYTKSDGRVIIVRTRSHSLHCRMTKTSPDRTNPSRCASPAIAILAPRQLAAVIGGFGKNALEANSEK